jgi:elongation factor Ts
MKAGDKMTEVTIDLIKKLREETDAPIMECKRALQQALQEQADGATEESLLTRGREILREAGKADAIKRSQREASQGTIAISTSEDGKALSAVLLLCETDFAAKSADFQALAQKLADFFLKEAPGEKPEDQVLEGRPVAGHLEDLVLKVRENIKIGAVKRLETQGVLGFYIHHDRAKAGIVALESEAGASEPLSELARQIAIHLVALPPQYITRDQIPPERIQEELELQKKRAINEGKPPEVAEKIAQGRLAKELFENAVLTEQLWWADQKKKVSDIIREKSKEIGGEIRIRRIIRLSAGQPELDVSA